MSDCIQKCDEVICAFLKYLNRQTGDYILKGDSALVFCYGLERLTESIKFDSTNKEDIERIVDGFCKQYNYSYCIGKETQTAKCFMINYANDSEPLKIEISYFYREFIPGKVKKVKDILVYDIDTLAFKQCIAYNGSNNLKDLYDLVFIYKNYQHELEQSTLSFIGLGMQYKDEVYISYLIMNQNDEWINRDEFMKDFFSMLDGLGIVYQMPTGNLK